MICISALCIVLALSSIAASADSKIDELKNEITSSVVGQLIIVTHDATVNKMDSKELNKKLMATTVNAFAQLEPQIEELVKLTGISPDTLAKELSNRIHQNQDLRNALQQEGELSPRFFGVLGAIGIISYDIIKDIVPII